MRRFPVKVKQLHLDGLNIDESGSDLTTSTLATGGVLNVRHVCTRNSSVAGQRHARVEAAVVWKDCGGEENVCNSLEPETGR